MVDESVTVKGTAVRNLQKFIDAELSPAQREVMLSRLPAEYVACFRTPILATETIPVHILDRFTEEAASARGESVECFARRAGREGASEALKGIYRFLALVMTPPALLSKAVQTWSSLYNRGELRVERRSETSARIRLVNFPSELAGCSRITGWIERMAELTGAKAIRVEQIECFAKGGTYCEWALTWSDGGLRSNNGRRSAVRGRR